MMKKCDCVWLKEQYFLISREKFLFYNSKLSPLFFERFFDSRVLPDYLVGIWQRCIFLMPTIVFFLSLSVAPIV